MMGASMHVDPYPSLVLRSQVKHADQSRQTNTGVPTLLSHVHVVDLPVAVLGLADATVGQGVAGVVWVHAKVEVVAGMGHGQLREKERERQRERERETETARERDREREREREGLVY